MYSSHFDHSFQGGASYSPMNPTMNPTMNRVEPMTLGTISPANSPSSPISNPYLPNFLIGDTATGFAPSSPRIWPMAGSPNKQRRSLTISPPSPMSSLQQQSDVTPNQTLARLRGDKPSGPPVTGLFESMFSPVSRNKSFMADGRNNNSFITEDLNSSSFAKSDKLYSSPAQLDPFYTQGESLCSDSELDESWVTVFGFPSAAASYILQQFSQYGTILEYKIESGGNWMHLHYQSKLEAKKALSKNGKVYGGSVMVGVKICIEKKVMDQSAAGKENTMNLSCSSFSRLDDSRNSSIRPLTQAYKVSTSERDVTRPNRTPQKSNTLISKTMDYMFGW